MQEHRRTHADQQAVGWLLVAVAVAGGCGRLLVVGVTKLSLPLKGAVCTLYLPNFCTSNGTSLPL